ncbi:MAG: NifU family protein [Planctomycetota bacterium]|jgi:Fe-S cluster biogenesis protein NfuA
MLDQETVESVLGEVRQFLQADGGDVEFVKVEGGKVHLRLLGACAGCPMRSMTLKNGIEKLLKERIPEVEEVVPV